LQPHQIHLSIAIMSSSYSVIFWLSLYIYTDKVFDWRDVVDVVYVVDVVDVVDVVYVVDVVDVVDVV